MGSCPHCGAVINIEPLIQIPHAVCVPSGKALYPYKLVPQRGLQSMVAHSHAPCILSSQALQYETTKRIPLVVAVIMHLFFLFFIITLLHIKYEQRNTITNIHIEYTRVQVKPSNGNAGQTKYYISSRQTNIKLT